jgi:hypothetical protein
MLLHAFHCITVVRVLLHCGPGDSSDILRGPSYPVSKNRIDTIPAIDYGIPVPALSGLDLGWGVRRFIVRSTFGISRRGAGTSQDRGVSRRVVAFKPLEPCFKLLPEGAS